MLLFRSGKPEDWLLAEDAAEPERISNLSRLLALSGRRRSEFCSVAKIGEVLLRPGGISLR